MLGQGQPSRALNIVLWAVGIAASLFALTMTRGWFDRHFLPSFAQSRSFQWEAVQLLRVALEAFGLVIMFVIRPRLRSLGSAVSILVALAAAGAVAELVLHSRAWHASQEEARHKEPARRADPLLGWAFVANRQTRVAIDGRSIDYATDAQGYRVAAPGAQTDFARPTIVLAGESILLGYGLAWPETIQARLAAMTGLQTANLSVTAYATDQSVLRLHRELPRFARPQAVAILFTPFLLDRNLDRDRPHLDASLRWHAAEPPSFRLVELGRRLIRYRSEARIDDGVAMTRAALAAGLADARRRGARAIVLVPQFLPEDEAERAVRRRVLDEAHLPYLLVPLRPEWRLTIDRHPDPRGAEAIAATLARWLAENPD
jgi:hypothetical protein